MLKIFILFNFIFCNLHCIIHSINDDNFEEFINSHNIVFLKVYAKWCSHSKALQKPF